MNFSTRLALVTSLCHVKEIGNPSPPWTGQHLFDFLSKARKPFCTSKRHLNINCTAMPARKDGNLVIRQGLPLRNYVWALSMCSVMESFPNKTAMHGICPPMCKGMMLASFSWRMAHEQPSQSPDLAPTVGCTARLTKGCCSWFRRASVHLA